MIRQRCESPFGIFACALFVNRMRIIGLNKRGNVVFEYIRLLVSGAPGRDVHRDRTSMPTSSPRTRHSAARGRKIYKMELEAMVRALVHTDYTLMDEGVVAAEDLSTALAYLYVPSRLIG